MADTDNRDVPKPVTDADLAIPPANASFTPAEPLKDTGVAFDASAAGSTGFTGSSGSTGSTGSSGSTGSTGSSGSAGSTGSTGAGSSATDVGKGAQAEAGGTTGDTTGGKSDDGSATPKSLKEGASALRGQAQDKARLYVEQGKAKATDSLGQLVQMLNDAAGQVDEKVGAQYGQYARTAADKVQGFSSAIDAKDVDELMDDVRELVRKSPAVAIGVAAGVGFVLARLLGSGLDQRDV